MRKRIVEAIQTTVEAASQQADMASTWKTPPVGFADAVDPLFGQLKRAIRPSHGLPGDLLPGARTVLENARLHEHYGLADVCSKCAAIVPCSFTDPVKLVTRKNNSEH